MNKIIEVSELTREYSVKNKRKKEIKLALKGISFDVHEGEIFGLLGPNGAGKTTTIKVLTTLLTPTSGDVKIMKKDVVKEGEEIRSNINFMFGGEKGVYGRLTIWEYLKYFACLYKVPISEQNDRIRELLKLVELEDKKNHKIYTFSKGMIQRVHIARSLINNPNILFLDEPTIGLDPVVAEKIRVIIENLSRRKITIILTTHYMKEADDLCDRIGIISQGEIQVIGTPKEIKGKFSHLNVFEATCRKIQEFSLNEHNLF
ncbi:multidrug ABC transporter ATP-binding protein, partial [Bacillus sp. 7504-2]